MAVPAVALEAALKELPEARRLARRLGEEFAHQFGLTVDEEYVGWKLLMILAWELWENKLKAPVKTLWTVEQQLSGLIEQLYKWAGGSNSAFSDGAALASSAIAQSTLFSWGVPGLVYAAAEEGWTALGL